MRSLVYPMFAMVLLTVAVLTIMFRSRMRAVREGALSAGFFKTYQGQAEPDYAAKPSRHFVNLFESPNLFYAACIAALAIRVDGTAMLALAWTYVALRCVHAFVHLGGNKLSPRMIVYGISWLVLLAMWVVLAIAAAR